MAETSRIQSGSPFEDQIGFCRALRVEDRVLVAGTAPVWLDGRVEPDPALQARRCLEIISLALGGLGATLAQVVRTRVYLVDAHDAAVVGGVHGEIFKEHRPVATMVVVAGLLDPAWRVEIEAEAISPRHGTAGPHQLSGTCQGCLSQR